MRGPGRSAWYLLKMDKLTLSVLVVHRPFLQFRSTLSLSQYTSFHGRVILLARLGALRVSRSRWKPSSILTRLTGESLGSSSAGRLLESPRSDCRPSNPGTLPSKACSRVTMVVAACPCSWSCPWSWSPTPTATEGLPSCNSTLSLLLSSSGRPHPHFSHFLSMCCPHILRQRRSSSANAFHDLDTWAARPSEMASRYPRIRMLTSRGRMENGSTRMIRSRESERWESCELQGMSVRVSETCGRLTSNTL